MINKYIVFDFDSTIVDNETLNDLINKQITNKQIQEKINCICDKALNGEINFHDSIVERFYLMNLTKKMFQLEGKIATAHLTKNIMHVFDFINNLKKVLWKSKIKLTTIIVSAGFKSLIFPTAKIIGIKKKFVYANEYITKNKKLTLKESALLYDEGKEKILDTFKGDKLMIGDGMSDYSVYKNKSAKMYCGFGINKVRYNVKNNCVNDHSGNVIYIEKTTDYFQLEKLIKKFVDINS